ncbi:MAG: hypothetical protein CL916_04280 [Deltaproteobacteria bacterium]|nr:hypothetical protein [Deltaproteobacteria bacterium]
MERSTEEKLRILFATLKEQGVEIEEMSHLALAVESTKIPVHKKAINIFVQNWKRVRGEMKESKEFIKLIKKARKEGKDSLREDEQLFIRQQLKDFFRVFPASIIAGANAILPIPGTSFVTPFLLKKLNLLPSRWREAYMLKTLQKAHQKLKEEEKTREIALLSQIETELEEQAQQRQKCDLLIVWDANQNGVWDEEEKQAYQEELHKTSTIYQTAKDKRSWFLLHEGLIFGPTALSTVSDTLEGLIRFQDKTQWVRYQDMLNFNT